VLVLDAKQANPAWSYSTLPAMPEPRKFANSVLLPDSAVLITGGSTDADHGATGGELFHPIVLRNTTWTPGPPEVSPPTYHACALLLDNGDVLSIGGDSRRWDLQIYQPHYVQAGNTRPVITGSPTSLTYGGSFPVSFTLAPGRTLAKASLTAPGSVTHSHDPNQRLVELAIQAATATSATLVAPPNPTKAPYGHYMLWLVDSTGEVSHATWTEL
jgi:galactose oxidase